jgi:tetratricopeptide (TPR) repeat protein
LIGSPDKQLILTPPRLAILKTNNRIKNDLEFSYWINSNYSLYKTEVFAAGFLYNSETLERISAHAPLFHDDVPRLEYNSVKFQRHYGTSLEEYVGFIKANLDPITNILSNELSDSVYTKSNFIRDYNLYNIIAMAYLRSYFSSYDFNLLKKALRWNPYNSIINFEMGTAYMKRKNKKLAEKYFKQTILFDPDNIEAINNLNLLNKTKLKKAHTSF